MSASDTLLPEPAAVAPLGAAERLARLRLARSENVGPRTMARLLARFGSAERALERLPQLAAGAGRRDYRPCPAAVAEAELAAGEAAGACLLILGEPDYPPLLAAVPEPPPLLWVRGDAAIFRRPAVAIVGARNASALGLRMARRLARELGAAGQVIVSGLARGIDAAAHEAALDTGTIAVLAGGIDRIYPQENAALAARIAESGALVAESPPGTEATARHFPRRNRVISGLARGVVLIEAAERSGSLITARAALDQGREAMACPGAPEDPRVGGCNRLIREGAALIRNAADVLEALPPLAAPSGPAGAGGSGLADPPRDFLFEDDGFLDDPVGIDGEPFEPSAADGAAPDPLADQILRLLGPHPVELDEIARQCGASPPEFSLALLELELAGLIEVLPGGMAARAGAVDGVVDGGME